MTRFCILFILTIIYSACVRQNKISTPENSTVNINIDSMKGSVQGKFNNVLAALDSAIGASNNTRADSIRIEHLKDSADKLYMVLDSLGVHD